MYYFLYSSLPSLKFLDTSTISVEAFDDLCRIHLNKKSMQELQSASLNVSNKSGASKGLNLVYSHFVKLEQYLRTFIAKKRFNVEDEKNTQLPDLIENFSYLDTELSQAAQLNPFEREKAVDKVRWNELDNLNVEDFHFNSLCVYRLKVMINEKYKERKLESGRENFLSIVEKISE